MSASERPRIISLISERLRSMVSNTFSACSWATSSVRSICRSAVSRVEIQDTVAANAKSATGRANDAATIHCSSLSELRCSVCTVAPTLPQSLRQFFVCHKVGDRMKLSAFYLRGRRARQGITYESGLYGSNLAFDQLELEFGDGLGRIEALRAGLGAVHDGVATIKPERVLEIVESFAGGFVAAVLDPARCLQQRCRSQEALAVPPVARARRRAAGAENAFVEAVEFLAVLVALPPFLLRRRRG